jgi:hypothetical protein
MRLTTCGHSEAQRHLKLVVLILEDCSVKLLSLVQQRAKGARLIDLTSLLCCWFCTVSLHHWVALPSPHLVESWRKSRQPIYSSFFMSFPSATVLFVFWWQS